MVPFAAKLGRPSIAALGLMLALSLGWVAPQKLAAQEVAPAAEGGSVESEVAGSGAAGADGGAGASASAPADDTAALIEALQDPAKREQLLRQLEILRAAQMLQERGTLPTAAAEATSAAPAVESDPAKNLDNTIAGALSSLAGLGKAQREPTAADAAASDAPESGGALLMLGNLVGEVRANVEDSWQWLGGLSDHLANLDQNFESPKFRAFWASLSIELLLILAVASVIGAVSHFLIRLPAQRLLGPAPTLTHLVWRNALGVVLKLLPAILFGLSGYVMVIAFDLSETARLVAMALINAQTAVLFVMSVGSLDLVVARERLIPDWFTSEAADFLRAGILRLAITLSYGVMTVELAGAMGVVDALIRLIVHIIGLACVGISLHMIRRLRQILALHEQLEEVPDASERSDEAIDIVLAQRSLAKAENSLRRNWASFATIGVLGFYLLWIVAPVDVLLFALRGAVLTIVIAVLARALLRLVTRAFNRELAGEGKPSWWNVGPWRRVRVYLEILRRAVVAMLCVLVGILILQIWGVDFVAWLGSPQGQAIIGSLVTILLLVIGGIVVSEMFSIAVESHLQKRNADYADLSRRSRARTLLPLLRNVVRIVLGTIIVLLVLGEAGVDIGPLLAAAGVVGLAVGFGAQTLVKDIITGIFILVEDTIAVGDVVNLDGNSGVVESMTIRTVRLRDQSGTVHTVPFSAITKVMNMTRDFSYAVFDISIAYDQDIRQVMDVIQAVAAELRKDPKLSRDILEPIEILGVDRFADSAVIIKARIKTKPIRQWEVGRNFNWRLKEAFDAAGIEIPFPQRTMHIVQPKKGREGTPLPDARPAAGEAPFREA
jgi:small conductance mechanosensitive channel